MTSFSRSPHPIVYAVAGGVVSSVLTIALLGGAFVFADVDPKVDTVPRYIPYNGVLENDGVPVTRSGANKVTLTFRVYDEDTNPDDADYIYTQDVQTNVYNGQFSALIGPSGTDAAGTAIDLQTVVGFATNLSVGITITDTDGSSVVLSNRQRLLMNPYAMWASHAADFNVADKLTVGGDAQSATVTTSSISPSLGDLTLVQNSTTALTVATDTVDIARPTQIGSGSPAAAYAQLRLDNNVGSEGFANYGDFQLLLHQANTAPASYGLGITSSTLAYNSNGRHRFYSGGTEVMNVNSSGAVTATSFNGKALTLSSNTITEDWGGADDTPVVNITSCPNDGVVVGCSCASSCNSVVASLIANNQCAVYGPFQPTTRAVCVTLQ